MTINLDLIFLVFLCVSAITVTLSFVSVNSKNKKNQTELAVYEAEAAEQRKLIEQLKAKESTRDLSATQALVAKRRKWNSFIKEMTYLMPPDVWILKMNIDGKGEAVTLRFSGLAPSQKSVNRFLSRMERSSSFHSVKLNSSKASPEYTPSLYAFDFSVSDVFSSGRSLASEGK
ncbi:MAG: PilN domain-containing protein [Bdellovibrionota bacterium]